MDKKSFIIKDTANAPTVGADGKIRYSTTSGESKEVDEKAPTTINFPN